MTTFDEIVDEFVGLHTDDPLAATFYGIHGKDHLMPDPSMERILRDTQKEKDLLEKIKGFPKDGLSFDQRLDLELAAQSLELGIFSSEYTYNGFTNAQQMPSGGGEVADAIDLLFRQLLRRDLPLERQYTIIDNIVARLEATPEYLRKSLGRITVPVKRWRDLDLAAAEGVQSLLYTVYDWACEHNYQHLEKLEQACVTAVGELWRYSAKLRQLPTTDNFVIGDEQARKLTRLKGVEISFEELHQMAKDFYTKSKDEIEELRERLVEKYGLPADTSANDLATEIKRKHPLKLEEVLSYYREVQADVLARISKNRLFDVPRDQELIIEATPEFMMAEIPQGCMIQPSPFGVKTGFIYVTVSPDKLLDLNRLSIRHLLLHEGIPGHHLHFASAFTDRSDTKASKIRKLIRSTDLLEGWTTTLEDFAVEAGFYNPEIKDEALFIIKKEMARLCGRVAIDLYFMTGDEKYLDIGTGLTFEEGTQFEKAGKLLQYLTGFTNARVQGELNWYSFKRGNPLSYLTGFTIVSKLINDMRPIDKQRYDELRRSEPTKYRDEWSEFAFRRRFHDAFLAQGMMSCADMRRVFEYKRFVNPN